MGVGSFLRPGGDGHPPVEKIRGYWGRNTEADIQAARDRWEKTDEVCGEAFDHETVPVYEDDEIYQWRCGNCGAEGWEDKE